MSKRDGSTPANAILEDQNAWCRHHCPGYSVVLQRLLGIDGKYVDELTLSSEDGDDVRVVYFDVSSHFGKAFDDALQDPEQ
jgi:hypothetical protein